MKDKQSGQTACIKWLLAWWGKAPGSQAVWGWSFIIICYQVSSIEPNESQDYRGNTALLSEGVSASEPCLSLRPPLVAFARPGHKPRQCHYHALLSVTMSLSRSLNLSVLLLSLSWCLLSLGMTKPMMDHGLQRHIDTHRTDLSANGQALIKGINQQHLSIKMRRLDMCICKAELYYCTHIIHTLIVHIWYGDAVNPAKYNFYELCTNNRERDKEEKQVKDKLNLHWLIFWQLGGTNTSWKHNTDIKSHFKAEMQMSK